MPAGQEPTIADVSGYAVDLARAYAPTTHIWVDLTDATRLRVGMDPLGVETSGTLVQISFVPDGTALQVGQPFATIEAAKFVGPLTAPVAGVVVASNPAVEADPSLPGRDPYGAGWLVEMVPEDVVRDMDGLVTGDAVRVWFAERVEAYRTSGVLAE